MANNRAYLCCTICALDETTTWEQTCRFLMKYYPSQGWYIPSETVKKEDGSEVSRIASLNDWLDTHKHGGMRGDFITLIDESSDPRQGEKRQILNALVSGKAKT